MKQRVVLAYKLARPDGWDFYTGQTINYRESIGKTVKCPNGDAKKGLCSSGVIHASKYPNDCFVGAKIPCSAYKVSGIPTCGDARKWGFIELKVIREINDLDQLFDWRYSEAVSPIYPFKLPKCLIADSDIELLKVWDSVWDSVRDSVRDSVWYSVWASVRDSVWDPVWDSVRDSVWASVRDSVWDPVWDSVRDSVRDSVWDSVRDSVWAYIGSFFPNIKEWKYIKRKRGLYPFQPAVELWKRGLVPSFDGKLWRLHSGEKAEIVWEGQI